MSPDEQESIPELNETDWAEVEKSREKDFVVG